MAGERRGEAWRPALRHRAAARAVPFLVAVWLVPAASLRAQEAREERWLPHTRWFHGPVADVTEPRFSGGILVTNLFDAEPRERPPFDFGKDPPDGADLQGMASLGGTFPLWGTPRDGGGVVVAIQAGVYARFRIEEPSRDVVAENWIVAIPVEFATRSYSGRVRVVHRSAHLGDELMATTGASRIEFSQEALDFLIARPLGGQGRVYGGGGVVFHSVIHYPDDAPGGEEHPNRMLLQAGAELGRYRWKNGRAGPFAAVDVHAHQRAGWEPGVSVAAGVVGRSNGRRMRLLLRYYQGRSPLGEFALSQERFFGVELAAEL